MTTLVTYPCANGQLLPGIHPDDVREAAGALRAYLSVYGIEESFARAAATLLALRERREISSRIAERRRTIVAGAQR